MRRAGWAAIGLGLLAWQTAAADGARSVASAGAVIASVDDETALSVDPAGLARATGVRISGMIGLVRAFGAAAGGEDRGGASWRGNAGVQVPVGDLVVVGASLDWPVTIRRAYPTGIPSSGDGPPGRYAGTRLELDERGILIGGAVRAQPWLALGVAVGGSRVELAAARVLSGGDGAELDLGFSAAAVDGFVPCVTVGALAAPDGAPLELALTFRWTDEIHAEGDSTLGESRDRTLVPSPGTAAAAISLPGRISVGAGVRLLAPRGAVELGGELTWLSGERDPAWDAAGIRVGGASLAPVPLGIRYRGVAGAVRIAGEMDLLRGLLQLTVGGAWERGPVPRSSIGPLAPTADAYVVSTGIAARTERARVTVAVAHRIADDAPIGPDLRVQGPGGTTSLPAATGMVSGGTTTFVMGLTIDFP